MSRVGKPRQGRNRRNGPAQWPSNRETVFPPEPTNPLVYNGPLNDEMTVSGAGTAGVNGVYAYQGFGQWVKDDCTITIDAGRWKMFDNGDVGSEEKYIIPSPAMPPTNDPPALPNPPETGWTAVDGDNPAPTIAYTGDPV